MYSSPLKFSEDEMVQDHTAAEFAQTFVASNFCPASVCTKQVSQLAAQGIQRDTSSTYKKLGISLSTL